MDDLKPNLHKSDSTHSDVLPTISAAPVTCMEAGAGDGAVASEADQHAASLGGDRGALRLAMAQTGQERRRVVGAAVDLTAPSGRLDLGTGVNAGPVYSGPPHI